MKRLRPLFLFALVLVLGTPPLAGASNQFLWKPSSESDGRLVVLFPKSYRLDKVASILVKGSTGTARPIRTSQNGANGDRIHARFPAGGASYGENVKVVLQFKGGGEREWTVPRGASRFEQNGGGTGAAAPAGGGGGPGQGFGPGFTGLDDVLGTAAKDALIVLSQKDTGKKEVTLAQDGKIAAIVCLRTYGQSSLSVTVNGKPWISWSRTDDSDATPCQADGKPVMESMYEENPGDFSARQVTISRDGIAGDVIIATLEGNFGAGESCVVVKPAAAKQAPVKKSAPK